MLAGLDSLLSRLHSYHKRLKRKVFLYQLDSIRFLVEPNKCKKETEKGRNS